MRVLFVTENLASNSTGRTYVLWLLAQHLGWESRIVSIEGETLWAPLIAEHFATFCTQLPKDHPEWRTLALWSDLIVAVKPLSSSLGIGRRLADDVNRPLLVDIDDPDLESILSLGRPFKAAAKMVLRSKTYWPHRRLRALVGRYERTTSNPTLQSIYGGALVPHARKDSGAGPAHRSVSPTIAFVGSNKPHKGVDLLRRANRALDSGPLTLTITDSAPPDAENHERWVGNTSLDTGIELVKGADIVVLPSLAGHHYSESQLPVKLIDAMMAGRAIIVADLAPLSWAVGHTGLKFEPGDLEQLTKLLAQLTDPIRRQRLGDAARSRALRLFTVEKVAPEFESACLRSLQAGDS